MNYTRTKIACYIGYFVQAIIVGFMPLLFITFNKDYGISFEKLGGLSIIIFLVQLLVDVVSIKLLKYVGYRGGAMIAHICAVIGFIMLAILPELMDNKYLSIVLSGIVFSVGGGLIEVIISPIIEYLPTKNKSAQMSLLHSFFCWGSVLTVAGTTALFAAFGRENWRWVSLLWAAISLANFFLFLRAHIIEPEAEKSAEKNKDMLRSPLFYALMLLMLAAGASEISVSQWASAFAEAGLGLPKVLGDLLGPCVFALLMGVGRLLYGLFGSKIRVESIMLVCGIFCLCCYMLMVLNIHPLLSLVACALTGLSVSVMWPGALSLSASRFPLGGTLLFGCAAAFGDSGCSVGPWMMGFMSEHHSMQLGFLLCSIFPIIIIVVAAFLKYGCKTKQNVLK